MPSSRVVIALLGCALVVGICAGAIRYSKRADSQLFGEVFSRASTQERVVALTFDDGPQEPDTRALLELLDREHVHATFFMVGRSIERYPELASDVVRRGHQVGNHSYSHAHMVFASAQFCRDEIGRTDVLLRQAGAKGPIRFRAPFGEKLWSLSRVLDEMHRLDVLSSVNSRDYDGTDSERIVSTVMDQIHPGAVVGLHDGGGPHAQTIAAVEQLIPALRAKGYRFVTVDELFTVDGR